jgi:RNA polymerase sigma-70 factor, ECF subfamily
MSQPALDATSTFDEHRKLLLGVAYRILGRWVDAEDVVQDAWLRWREVEHEGVENPRAYLVQVTTRLAIDRLRRAQTRHETYVGEWLPEPVLTEPDVADSVAMSESVSLAMLVVLEALSPLERAVFVLREAFDFGYDEIAEIVGKSEANCRQLATRARRHVEERRPRFEPSREQRDELTRRFVAALQEGETGPLVELLAEDAAFYGDGGGKAPAVGTPVAGADAVARVLAGFARVAARRGGYTVRPAEVNGGAGVLGYEGDRLIMVWALEISGGVVHAIRGVVNPDKLRHLA